MWRGSIHALSVLAVSLRPPPSMPENRISTRAARLLRQRELRVEQRLAQARQRARVRRFRKAMSAVRRSRAFSAPALVLSRSRAGARAPPRRALRSASTVSSQPMQRIGDRHAVGERLARARDPGGPALRWLSSITPKMRASPPATCAATSAATSTWRSCCLLAVGVRAVDHHARGEPGVGELACTSASTLAAS